MPAHAKAAAKTAAPKQRKPAPAAVAVQPTSATFLLGAPLAGLPPGHATPRCACGGGCPKCTPRRRNPLDALGLDGPGQALPETLRGEFRLRTGHDPLGVRLHTDSHAAAAARRQQANAFTFGSHIVFGSGRFSPNTRKGRRLLFHELIHAIQQQGAHDDAATPAVSTDRALELEAHRAGPGPVLGRLRQRAIQKEDETETAPAPILGEGEHFRWIGPNEAPTVVVSTAWLLRSGVPRTATRVPGDNFPGVLRPILLDLVPRYPWATAERAERGVRTAFLQGIGAEDWASPEMRFPLGRSIFAFLGLPPDRPVQVFPSGSEILCFLDFATLYGDGRTDGPLTAEARLAIKQNAAQMVLTALEELVGAPPDPIAADAVASQMIAAFPDEPWVYRFMLIGEAPSQLFGDTAWQEFLEAHPVDDTVAGALLDFGAASFRASSELNAEDLEFAQRLLREIFGEPPADATPPENPEYLSLSDLQALRADSRASLRDLIETAAARVDWERAQDLTRFNPGEGDGRDAPIVPRPVRGQITNADRLVPGMEAQFRFQTLDTVDAWRNPHVTIHWEAWRVDTDADSTSVRTFIGDDNMHYIETRAEGWLNERTFDVTFDAEGDYEIHAFVDHNFYLPAHFMTMVRVKTETARADEARAEVADAFGHEDAATIESDYRFDAINTEEFLFGSAIGGPLTGWAMSELLDDYERGTRAEGTLVEAVAHDATFAFYQRLGELDDEIMRLQATLDALEARHQDDLAGYVRERLGRLTAARERVLTAMEEINSHGIVSYGVATQAFFISRRAGVRNAQLDLLCWYTIEGSGDDEQFHLHLIDQTELTETDHYEFDITTHDFEAGMQYLFLELGKSYPDGTLSFAFQLHTHEDGATERLVRYERVTDTAYTDTRDVVFSTAVNLTVNLVALLLTLFPPTTFIGITLGLAYNAAALAATHGEDLRTGTLHGGRLTLDLGMLALDIIPVLGRLSGRFVVGARVYRTIELTQYAGMVLMLTDDGARQLTHLRDSQITRLAELQQRIRNIESVNASDPELDRLRSEEAQLIIDTRNAAAEVFFELASNQALILGSMAMIGHVAEPHLTRAADAPLPPPDGSPAALIDETPVPPRATDADETPAVSPPREREVAEPTTPRPATDESTPTDSAGDDASTERAAAGRGRPPSDGTPPPPPRPPRLEPNPDPAYSRERLIEILEEGVVALPPPLPREAVANPPRNHSTFAQGQFTAQQAYTAYNQALAVSLGREVAIYYNPHTGEYAIRIGDPVTVRGPAGPWEAVVHFHPNPHNAHQLRLPSAADIFTRENFARAFDRGEVVREFVEFTIPGVGRGRIEYGIDPTHPEPFYLRIFEPDQPPAVRRFRNQEEYLAFWSDHDDMYVAPGSPLYRQLEAAFDAETSEARARRSATEAGDPDLGTRQPPAADETPEPPARTDSETAPETPTPDDSSASERSMAGRGTGRTPPRTTTPSTVPLMDASGQLTAEGITYIQTHYGEYEITPSFLGRRARVDSLTPEQIRQEFNNRAGWLEEVIRAERLGSFTTTRPDIDFTLPRETQMRSFARLFQEALDREGAGRQLDLSVLSENTGTYIETLVAAGDPVVAPYYQQCEALARTDPAFRREWHNFLWGNQRSGSAGRRGPSGEAGSAFMLGVNGYRKLDMADVLVSANTVRVADASFAYLSPIHNFKTAYYRSLIERLMPGFTVTAEDIRSATRRRAL